MNVTLLNNHSIGQHRRKLLDWYDRQGRVLPWRAMGAQPRQPYHIWLSEMMLQQTTVATVRDYFAQFTTRWPRLEDLAAASLEDVRHGWQGLGYYQRAKNLHACAQVVTEEHGGVFPGSPPALEKLPGIGPYSSAAIAAIAFDFPVLPVDGNIIRVFSRLYACETPLPALKRVVMEQIAPSWASTERPGDFAQAMMDLGATVCRPTKPSCGECPWQSNCQAFRQGLGDALPRKNPKPERPHHRLQALILQNEEGAIFVRKRSERRLLSGLYEVPFVPGLPQDPTVSLEPSDLANAQLAGSVVHVFTHFKVTVSVLRLSHLPDALADWGGQWVAPHQLEAYPFSTLMHKVLRSSGFKLAKNT